MAEKEGLIAGFKTFILRGNVVELAIAVVIGTAFQAVVSSFTGAIITPILNALPGASSNGFGFALRHGDKFTSKTGANTTFINFSTIINAVIVFILTAAVVYFIFVVPMNRFMARRAVQVEAGEDLPGPKSEDIILLEQIRDLLAGAAAE